MEDGKSQEEKLGGGYIRQLGEQTMVADVVISHFLFGVGLNRRMIGPTPVFMRLCGAKDTPEACTQWVNNKTSPFSSLSTPL
jgi:hypothetical protein